MRLIIVDRTKPDVLARLRRQFADDPNVRVIVDRRRDRSADGGAHTEQRRLQKSFNGKGYIVVHTADESPQPPPPMARK